MTLEFSSAIALAAHKGFPCLIRTAALRIRIICLSLAIAILTGLNSASAQDFSKSARTEPIRYFQLAKLLGKPLRFTAEMDFTIIGTNGTVETESTSTLAMTKGKLRTESETSATKTPVLPEEAVAAGKRVGMNKHISISRIDERQFYYLFPEAGLHYYEPISAAILFGIEQEWKAAKIKRKFISREVVNGYECEKHQVSVRLRGGTSEGFIWYAPKLQKFPVKIDLMANGERVIMSYRNISRDEPSPSLFEVPTNSVRKASAQEIIAAAKEQWTQRLIDKAKQQR